MPDKVETRRSLVARFDTLHPCDLASSRAEMQVTGRTRATGAVEV